MPSQPARPHHRHRHQEGQDRKARRDRPERIKREPGRNIVDLPGGGAAGGLGSAMVAFLDAVLLPGSELIAKRSGSTNR
jgi:glycerate kinase